jgi:flagellar motor switch protein FliM
MLVRVPDFNNGGAAFRPFRFTKLEKVSRAQALLIDRLDWLMPGVDANGRVGEALLTRLKELFEGDVRLQVDSLQVVRPRELRRYISDPTVLAALVPAPNKPRGFLEMELSLAHAAIDQLLGGAGESVALRPLTEIEEGVITFLVIEALKSLAPEITPGLPRIRLDAMARHVEEVVSALAEEAHVAVVQLKAVIGDTSGFVRLFIPESVLSMTNPQVGSPARRARTASYAQRYLKRLAGVKTWLRAEIGRAQVTTGDLTGLDQGDVVLVDELTCRAHAGEPGTARLRVGMGRVGHLDAEVSLADGRFQAKVTGISYGQETLESRGPSEGDEEAAEALLEGDDRGDDEHTDPVRRTRGMDLSESNEGAELLNDIPLQISVELSRMPVTAEQVVSLRVGQILDLGRVPGEPVDLSVNGKVVARGELVEVEGHMGVRILSLAG